MRVRPGASWLAAALVAAPAALPAHPLVGQEELHQVAGSVARAWSRGDVPALAGWMEAAGIELHVGQENHPRLGVRQARAALEKVMTEHGPGRAVLGRVEALEGVPRKGFAEIRWMPRDGAPTSGRAVFVGFREREGRWRISEIRILPGGLRARSLRADGGG